MAWDKVEALNESFISGLTNCAWGLDNSIIVPNTSGQRSVISFRNAVVNYAGVEITIRAQNANGAIVNLELLSDINNPNGGQKAVISGATAFPQTTYIHKFPYCGDIEGLAVFSIGFGTGPVEILSIKFLRPTAKIVSSIDATQITPAFPAPWAFDGTQNAWVRNYVQGTGGDSVSFTFARKAGYYAHAKIVVGAFGVFKDYQVRFQQNLISSTTPVMELYWDTNDISEATTQNITFEVTATQFASVSVFLDSAYFPALPSAFGYSGPAAVASNSPAPQLSQLGTAALHSDSEYLHVVNNLGEINAAAARVNLGLGTFSTTNIAGAALAGITSISLQYLTALVNLNVSGGYLYGAADVLEQRNGVNPQTLRIYGSYTDANNYERLSIATAAGNVASIIMESLGSGFSRGLRIGTGGLSNLLFRTAGVDQWSMSASSFAPLTNNTLDVGASLLAIRNIYLGTQIFAADGAVGTPPFSFISATNTGIYRTGGGSLSMAVGGTERVRADSNGVTADQFTLGLSTSDVKLVRDAANILALRNSTTAQEFRAYNTFTDASNFERAFLRFNTNILELGFEALGTGNTGRGFRLKAGGTMAFFTASTERWDITSTGNLVAATDNTLDIGATGATRPRSLYWGTQALAPNGTKVNPAYGFAGATGDGWYWRTAGFIGFSTGGKEQALIGTSGGNFQTSLGLAAAGTDFSITNPDLILTREAANQLGLRNGLNSQSMLMYNTFTDASNYERMYVGFSSNVAFVLTQQLGTGSSRSLTLGTNGATGISFRTNTTDRWLLDLNGVFTPILDGTYDIGSGSARVRQVNSLVYLGASLGVDPTASQIPAGFFQVYKNTGSGAVKIWYNDGGTLKSVALV